MRCSIRRFVSIMICVSMLIVSTPQVKAVSAQPPPSEPNGEYHVTVNELSGAAPSGIEPEAVTDSAALAVINGTQEEKADNEAKAEEASRILNTNEEPAATSQVPPVLDINENPAEEKTPQDANDDLIEEQPLDGDALELAPLKEAEEELEPVVDDEKDRVLIGVSTLPEINGDEYTRVCEDAEVIITATYTSGANIPDDAEFVAKKIIGQEKEMFKNALDTTSGQALSLDMVIHDIVFYDISFILNGEVIEPDEPVKMRFDYKQMPFSEADANAADSVTILHLTDSSSETADAEGPSDQFLVQDVLQVEESLPIEPSSGDKLFDRVDVIEPVVGYKDNRVSDLEFSADTFSIYAVALVSIQTTETLYKRVSSIDDPYANYLIVAADRNYALKAGVNTSTYSALVYLVQVKGHPEYYSTTTDITPDMLFNFSNTGSSTTSTVKSRTGYYLNIPQTAVLNIGAISFSLNNAQQIALTYTNRYSFNNNARQQNTWVLGYMSNDLYSYDGNFRTDNLRQYEPSLSYYTYLSQRSMLIYKQVSDVLTVPGEYVGDGETDIPPDDPEVKPSYPAYIRPSGEKSGSYNNNGTQINYNSDASTSQIENDSIFSGRFSDDGKIWADKSVVYGSDDYNAYPAYGDGAFSVTLSALTQKRIDESKSYDYPLDFVFILDTSGSMNTVFGGKTRAELLNNALNLAIHAIMKSHPDNKVGIVDFATDAKDDLPLGRYYVGRESDIPNYNGAAYDYYYTTVDRVTGDSTMHPNANLRNAVTKNAVNAKELLFTGATFTQMGIQQGANMLLNNSDIYFTPFEGIQKSRTPVLILMSDGVPTLGTNHWMDPAMGPVYGQGNNSVGMAPGIMGYYTIFTANYFKGMVNNHYQDNSLFYTIGFGISNRDSAGKYDIDQTSNVGDEYARAVLNPSSEYLQDLLDRPRGTGDEYIGYYGRQLYALLNRQPLTGLINGSSTSSYIQSGQNVFDNSFGVINNYIPVIQNPYDSFSYATSTYSDNEMTQSKLDEMMSKTVRRAPVRQLAMLEILKENTPVEFTDYIGEGMEIQGIPVIRYNGVNYQLRQISSSTAADGCTTVTYRPNSAIVKDCEGNDVNLQDSVVTIITGADGKQSIKWSFTEELLPAYRKSLWFDYYFEMLPIRLIYQVKPTAAAMNDAVNGYGSMLYVSEWERDLLPNVTFIPSTVNPYYIDTANINRTVVKTSNNTGTLSYSFSSGGSSSAIKISLGNNGRVYTDNYGNRLPETGGAGVDPFVFGGVTIMLAAIFLYIRQYLIKKQDLLGGN